MKLYKISFCYVLSTLLCINSVQADLIWTTSFGKSGYGNGEFNTPYGIRVHPITGEVWVADSSNSRLQVFKNDHSFSKVFDTKGHGDTRPVDLVFDTTGKMYVGDYDTGNIQIYDNTGNYLNKFQGNNKLGALAIDSTNQIYTTTSVHNSTLKRYDSSGVLKDEFYYYAVHLSTGITIGPDDKIYYANGNFHEMISRNNDLSKETIVQVLKSSTWINGIDHGYNGKIYIADTNGTGIIVIKEDGEPVQHLTAVAGQSFNKPHYIIGDKQGKFYVSDTGNNRVVVLFDPTAWTKSGTPILGTLNLTEDLTLNSGYNLKVQSIDDTTSDSVLQSDGKLTLSSPATLTVNTGSTITADSFIIDGGVLSAASDVALNTNIQLSSGDNSINANDGAHLRLSGIISGAGSKLKKLGSGILSLAGVNTYSGGTDIEVGTVSTGSASALGRGAVTMADRTTLQASSDLALSKAITIAGKSTIDTQGHQVTSSGVISGTGQLGKKGTGTLALSGANTYGGGTHITAGTVHIGSALALGSGAVTMADRTTLQAGVDLTLSQSVAITGTGNIDTQGHTMTSNNGLLGNGNIVKKGSGTLVLAGPIKLSGTNKLQEGIIKLTGSGSVGSSLRMSDGTKLQGEGNASTSTAINLPSTGSREGIIEVLSDTLALSGIISGTGSKLKKLGAGILSLSGVNTYSGDTDIAAGTVHIGSASALGRGAVTMADRTTLQAGVDLTLSQSVAITGTGNIDTQGHTITSNNRLSGNGNIIKKGSGTLVLAGPIKLSGSNSLEEGIIKLTGSGSVGSSLSMSDSTKLQGEGNASTSTAINLPSTGSKEGIIEVLSDTLALSGLISGTGSKLKKLGAGILSLSGVNTYSGGTDIAAGTVHIGSASALGSGAVTMADRTTLQASSDLALSKAITIAGTSTIDTQGHQVTSSGVISGTGQLGKKGTGTLALSGANTYSGGTDIAAGTVHIGSASALGRGAVTMADRTTLQASSDLALSKAITIAGKSTIDTQGHQVTSSGVISGTGQLGKKGTGTLALSGANTYSGGTDIAAGTVHIGSASALGRGAVTMADRTTLQASSDLALSKAITIAGKSTIDTQGHQVTSSGVISGTGQLAKQGTGTLALSGANTYGGGTHITAGTVHIGSASALGSGAVTMADRTTLQAGVDLTLSQSVAITGTGNIDTQGHIITSNNRLSGNGNIIKKGSGTLVLAGPIKLSGSNSLEEGIIKLTGSGSVGSSLTMSDSTKLQGEGNASTSTAINLPSTGSREGIIEVLSDTLALSGLISGTDSKLKKLGAGILSLSGVNTYSGGTDIAAGTVHIGSASALGSGAVTMADRTTLQASSDLALSKAITIAGTSTIDTQGHQVTSSGVISGTGQLAKQGTGTLALSGANTYGGGTHITAGTVHIGSASALGRGAVTMADRTTLQAGVDLTLSQSVAITGTGNIDTQGHTITSNNRLSGNGNIIKKGSGTLVLAGPIKLSGSNSLEEGIIKLTGSGSVGSSLSMSDGTKLQGEGNASTSTAINLPSTGSKEGIIEVLSDTLALSGLISGTDSKLKKLGEGILSLSGVNTYSGGTDIAAGTVHIGSASALGRGAVTMADRTTLQASSDLALSKAITIAGKSTIDTQGHQVTSSGVISGTGQLAKQGTGTLALSGANTYGGGTHITAGTVHIGSASALGSGAVTMADRTTLQAGVDLTLSQSVAITGTGNIDTQGHIITSNNRLSGNGNIIKKGSGTLVLAGPIKLSGSNSLEEGIIKLTGSGSVGSSLSMSDSTKLQGEGNASTSTAINLPSTGSREGIIEVLSDTLALSGLISGTDSKLKKLGAGILSLSGVNTYSGGTDIAAGTVHIGSASALGSGAVTMADRTTLQASSDLALSKAITIAGTSTIDTQGHQVTSSGVISGTGQLAKQGTGTLALSGANTYGGGTHITAGTVHIGSASALGRGAVTMADRTTLQAGVDLTLSQSVAITGTGNIDTQGHTITSNNRLSGNGNIIKKGSGTLVLAGPIKLSGSNSLEEGIIKLTGSGSVGSSLSMSDGTKLQGEGNASTSTAINLPSTGSKEGIIEVLSDTLALSGLISGTDSKLKKLGEGILSLSGVNTYSGGTDIAAGTVHIGSASALGRGAVTMADRTTLSVQTSDNITLNNNISGGGKLDKSGSADLALNGESNYSGNTNLNEGSISLGSSTALGNSVLTMSDNTILNLNNNINVENTINLGNSNTIGVPGSFIGILTGLIGNTNSNLSKKGVGTLLLKSGSNHQGVTQVEKGTLHIDNVSLGGDVTVSSNGRLKGTGYLLSKLINNGVIAPGSSPGIMYVKGDYKQNPQGTLEIYIRPSSNPIAGVDYAQLNVTGTANIGGNLLIDAEHGDYTEGVRYNILKAAGEINGRFDNITLNTAGVYNAKAYYHLHDVFLQLSRKNLPHFEHLEDKRALFIYIHSLDTRSPEFIKAINPIYNMSYDSLRNSLSSIAPDRHLVANYISQDLTNLIHDVNITRLDNISSITVGNNTSDQLGFNQINRGTNKLLSSPTRGSLMSNFTNNLNNNLLNSDKHYVWFLPFGQSINKKPSSNRHGYDGRTLGMLLGYDYKINDSTIGGISLGHYKSSFNYTNNQGSNNKIKSVFATLYGNKQVGNGYIRGSLFSAQNDNKLNREIHIGENIHSTSSNHNSYVISPRIEMGYNIKGDYNYQITPFISTEYSMEFNKGYQERGDGALNMCIKSRRNDLISSELGLKLKKAIKLGNEEELRIKAKLSYINKKRFNSKNKIRGRFIEQGSKYIYYSSYNGSRVEHHISPGIGLEVKQDNDTIIGINYNGEISKLYSNHEVMLEIGRQF